jgi:hypothetical protein
MIADTGQRRHFITLLGGTAVSWPLAALAQRPERIKRIGWLDGSSGADPKTQVRLGTFRRELEALGWVEGRTVEIVLVLMPLIQIETGIMSQNSSQRHRT